MKDRFGRFEIVVEQNDGNPGGIRFPRRVAEPEGRCDRFSRIVQGGADLHAGFDSPELIACPEYGDADVVQPERSAVSRLTFKAEHIAAALFPSGPEREGVPFPIFGQRTEFPRKIVGFARRTEVRLRLDAAAPFRLKGDLDLRIRRKDKIPALETV